MRYIALVYGNEEIWHGVEDFPSLVAEVDAFNAALRASGELVDVNGLLPQPRAVRGGRAPAVTDGPYLEAKEYIGSYFVLDVVSEERALEIAQSYPALRYGEGGGLEVWPLMHS
jgi:hypothetical protein